MKRALLVFLLTGMALLSSCGSTADTQSASEAVSESTETSDTDATGLSAFSEESAGAAELSYESRAGAAELSYESRAGEAEGASTDNKDRVTGVEISFDYSRMTTKASNQIAVWVEDEDGDVIKTIYVSDFTGSRRGYEKRGEAIPHWVAAADPGAMSDEEIDAVSSATLRSGSQLFAWDLTDDQGNEVPEGKYTIKLEGTLFWGSNVVYSGTVDTANDIPGEIDVQEERSEPDNTDNETMIQNVKMTERGR